MNFGFQKPFPMRWEPWPSSPDAFPDGRNWKRLDYLYFTRKDGTIIRALPGVTDFVSTPREIWFKIAPFDYALCGDLHDQSYHDNLEWFNPASGQWEKYQIHTHFDGDELLDEALESRGCGEIERFEIVNALKMFGEIAFNNDRTKPLAPTPVPC